mmetsp:Transcript_50126/g.92526  ORF Transcript_50126/g.92526 Transcript_50126/m.92526 type:complete len:336 (-) Transcript_50126:15-1022(-)
MASKRSNGANEVTDAFGTLPSVGTWLGSRNPAADEVHKDFPLLLERVTQLEARVEAIFSGHSAANEQWQRALATFRGVQEDLAAKVDRVAVQLEKTVVPKLTESQADLSGQVKEVRTALSTWMRAGDAERKPEASGIDIEGIKDDLLKVKESVDSTSCFKGQFETLQQSLQQLDKQLQASVKDGISFASRLEQLESREVPKDVIADAPPQGTNASSPLNGSSDESVQALEERLLKELANSQDKLRSEVLHAVHEEYDKLIAGLVEPAEEASLSLAEGVAADGAASADVPGRLWQSLHADGSGAGSGHPRSAPRWQPARSRPASAFDGLYDALVVP